VNAEGLANIRVVHTHFAELTTNDSFKVASAVIVNGAAFSELLFEPDGWSLLPDSSQGAEWRYQCQRCSADATARVSKAFWTVTESMQSDDAPQEGHTLHATL
jgi:hypothetical protein